MSPDGVCTINLGLAGHETSFWAHYYIVYIFYITFTNLRNLEHMLNSARANVVGAWMLTKQREQTIQVEKAALIQEIWAKQSL